MCRHDACRVCWELGLWLGGATCSPQQELRKSERTLGCYLADLGLLFSASTGLVLIHSNLQRSKPPFHSLPTPVLPCSRELHEKYVVLGERMEALVREEAAVREAAAAESEAARLAVQARGLAGCKPPAQGSGHVNSGPAYSTSPCPLLPAHAVG